MLTEGSTVMSQVLEDLVEGIKKLDVSNGDILYVASEISQLLVTI